MDKTIKYLLVWMVMVVMTGVYACNEQPSPPPPKKVVKQKIAQNNPPQPAKPAVEKTAAPAPGQAAEQEKTAAPAPGQAAEQEKTAAPAPGQAAEQEKTAAPAPGQASEMEEAATPTPAQALEQEAIPSTGDSTAVDAATKDQQSSELVRESLEIATGYDPKGRFDPFEPLFKDEPEQSSASVSKDKRKKREPQTPLERIAISQLKLSAIMRTSKGNSAIVEDATGKGYVIRKGTYVGLNSGQVIRIDRDHVVIEEEIENVMGELIIQDTELKLQKPAGEL